jgi:hypothetical protein
MRITRLHPTSSPLPLLGRGKQRLSKPEAEDPKKPEQDKPARGRLLPDPRGDAFDSITIAAFDVDHRIFRSIWHTLFHTPRVGQAGLAGDYSTYLSPIRVFVALVGLQFAVAAIFGAPATFTTEVFLAGMSIEASTQILNGHSVIEVDDTLLNWLSLLVWPLTIIASIPYILALKLSRPAMSWWGHVTIYLVASNASFIIMAGMLPFYPLGQWTMLAGTAIGLLVFLIALGRLVARFYARTPFGTAWRLILLTLLLPVTMLIGVAGQFLAAHWVLKREYNVSLIDIIEAASNSGASP